MSLSSGKAERIHPSLNFGDDMFCRSCSAAELNIVVVLF